jgi:hypothetical protein
MYGWIWRHLPGRTWAKASLAVALVIGVIVALFLWVFPWVSPLLPFQQETVGG